MTDGIKKPVKSEFSDLEEMHEYADGGVLALNEIFKVHKSFTIPDLIRDAEELWKERAKELQNINLS